ncbi:hypothetical protein F4778DRAFT_599087 [Xylariomycetidae sp. FL2044]|nr:hypothetical protein F4778DRAFT_599087 [Xylariomycetidae sp. FL2044]
MILLLFWSLFSFFFFPTRATHQRKKPTKKREIERERIGGLGCSSLRYLITHVHQYTYTTTTTATTTTTPVNKTGQERGSSRYVSWCVVGYGMSSVPICFPPPPLFSRDLSIVYPTTPVPSFVSFGGGDGLIMIEGAVAESNKKERKKKNRESFFFFY